MTHIDHQGAEAQHSSCPLLVSVFTQPTSHGWPTSYSPSHQPASPPISLVQGEGWLVSLPQSFLPLAGQPPADPPLASQPPTVLPLSWPTLSLALVGGACWSTSYSHFPWPDALLPAIGPDHHAQISAPGL